MGRSGAHAGAALGRLTGPGRSAMARLVLQGRAGSTGAGMGRLVRPGSSDASISAATPARVDVSQRSHEQDRLRQALEQASHELAQLAEETRARAGAETAAIFEAQALFVK